MFETIHVDRSRAEAAEQMGTKRKFWFSRQKSEKWLFKAEERGTGEDWAEKIAAELASLIGLPHVHYELAAEYDGERMIHPGVIYPHGAPAPLNLILGNQLLLARDPDYPGDTDLRYKLREHTVEAVTECLRQLAPPPEQWLNDLPEAAVSALDVFIGYVMFDAWIANQDRHHENWAAIRIPEESRLRLPRPSIMERAWHGIFQTANVCSGSKARTSVTGCRPSRPGRGQHSTGSPMRSVRSQR